MDTIDLISSQSRESSPVQDAGNIKHCKRCHMDRPVSDFVRPPSTRTNRAPLGAVNTPQRYTSAGKPYKVCVSCRRTQDAYAERARKKQRVDKEKEKAETLRLWTWEVVRRELDRGYIRLMFKLNFRWLGQSYGTTKQCGISDIRQHIPPTIDLNSRKSIAQYVVDEITRSEGLRFWYKSTYTLSAAPRHFPSSFKNAAVMNFVCSQRKERKHKPKDRSFQDTRNSSSMPIFNCHGTINVLFPSHVILDVEDDLLRDDPHSVFYVGDKEAQIAIQYTHSAHPGREAIGVPVNVREWIKNNPRPTAQKQRNDLLAAIDRGEIDIDSGRSFFTSADIHYWWKKMQVRVERISADP